MSDPLEKLTKQERENLVEMVKEYNPSSSSTKRDFLKTLGVAGTIGAGGMLASSGGASASSGSNYNGTIVAKKFKGQSASISGTTNTQKLDSTSANTTSLNADGITSRQADITVWKEGSTVKAGSRSGLVQQGSDAATVVQAALDQLNSNGGGTLWIAAGNYSQSANIHVHSNITVVGAGMGQTVITDTGPYQWDDNPSTSLKNFVIRDLTFDGTNQGSASGGAAGMYFVNDPENCTAQNLEIKNAGSRNSGSSGGFAFRNGKNNTIQSCHADNCANVGLSVQHGAHNTIADCLVTNPNTTANFSHCLSMEGADYSKVVNCTVDGNGKPTLCVNSNNVSHGVVDSNVLYNGNNGVNIANATAIGTVISNNTIDTMGSVGILIQQSSGSTPSVYDNTVIGNTIFNAQVYGIQINNTAHADFYYNRLVNVSSSSAPSTVGIYAYEPMKPCHMVGNQIGLSASGNGISHGVNSNNKRLYIYGNICTAPSGDTAGIDTSHAYTHAYFNVADGLTLKGNNNNVFFNDARGGRMYLGNDSLIGFNRYGGGDYGISNSGNLAVHNQNYNPQGWSTTTPSIPATGSSNSVTNSNPYPVLVYQSGASGTHVIDPSGTDTALPADDQPITLSPGAQIYYASTAPSSWDWYGQ